MCLCNGWPKNMESSFNFQYSFFHTGCDENDANHFAKLLAMNWSKIFVPSACGTCSCGAAWDKRDVSDDWLDVEGCHVAYLYDFHCVNGL